MSWSVPTQNQAAPQQLAKGEPSTSSAPHRVLGFRSETSGSWTEHKEMNGRKTPEGLATSPESSSIFGDLSSFAVTGFWERLKNLVISTR